MSTLKTNNVQVGQSVTATNNFTLYQPASPDGTVRLGVGNSGATTADVITVSSSTVNVAANLQQNGVATSRFVQATAVASTSGTSIDFTGIPSWVKRITVMFSGVSTNGTAFVMVQLGTGGTPTTSGYGGGAWQTSVYTNVTNGMALSGNNVATDVRNGAITITNITGNTWVSTGTNFNNNPTGGSAAGSIALSGTLNLVRVTTVNGTDAFDAGTINILYEG
jgi:hypothetical protein